MHIDNTPCYNDAKQRPSKSKIAYYWKDKAFEYFGYLMDWGEPSCWACGKFNSHYDMEIESDDMMDFLKVWDNHSYLERCHIKPVAHGGCNCEANLVILCKDCHRRSPDTVDPHLFVRWVRNRRNVLYKEFLLELENMGFSPTAEDLKLLLDHHSEFMEYIRQSAIPVAGRITISTHISCVIEFIKDKEK